ncbi:MAG: protein kinase [Gemmatimonadota bacterium]|nr:MAG: protein kinase [Gemmatimonadota bacterium]
MADQFAHFRSGVADRYEIERELGRGGMAVVFLALDRKHDRPVVLKVLRPEVSMTLGAHRFLREVRIAARLSHPHVVTLIDSDEIDGFLFSVMAYVEGESLRDRLVREGRLSLGAAMDIARQVASALDYAHSRDVVHRDVKPENILLCRSAAVVTDFGIARAISEATEGERLTDPGVAVGTSVYMSPEQASGELEVDGRSDVYALGCVLYELLTGEPPFSGRNHLAILAAKVKGELPGLRALGAAVPKGVERAIVRALAPERDDRFGSAGEFVAALEAAIPAGAVRGPSIAVLPFSNIGADPENEYLGDAIADEIIAALGRVRALQVAPRSASFAYKGQSRDIREIGKELEVSTVLEGSVRRAGRKLRITAQLIDVSNGYHLWSERYDRDMEDVFAIQDEIGRNITQALKVILSEEEQAAISRARTGDIEAYDYYLRGRQFFSQFRRKPLQFAREMFDRAIEIDPDYALAYAGLADCCSFQYMYWGFKPDDLETAETASRRALELAPELGEAHAARGLVLSLRAENEAARVEFETAIRLDPRLFEARYFYARTCFQEGRLEEAVRLFGEAANVREDYKARFFVAQSLAALGREGEAEAAYRQAFDVAARYLELNPDDAHAFSMGAVSLCRTGDKARGLEWAERAISLDPDDAGIAYNVACLFSLEGESDRAFASLRQAVEGGFARKDWFERDPDLDPIRDDARFKELLAAL